MLTNAKIIARQKRLSDKYIQKAKAWTENAEVLFERAKTETGVSQVDTLLSASRELGRALTYMDVISDMGLWNNPHLIRARANQAILETRIFAKQLEISQAEGGAE